MASVQCSHCGNQNPPEALFCANCGSSLKAPSTPIPPPVAGPVAAPATPLEITEYAGFWIRFAAALIDGVIVMIATLFPLVVSFGPFIASPIIIGGLYYWLLTGLNGQTIGKMAVGVKVVNARGAVPGLGISALREIPGKIVSSIIFCVGYLWIAGDAKKQGWHDKIAGTYVVSVKPRQ